MVQLKISFEDVFKKNCGATEKLHWYDNEKGFSVDENPENKNIVFETKVFTLEKLKLNFCNRHKKRNKLS